MRWARRTRTGVTMSNEVSATTAVPTAPTGLAAAATGPTNINLTWNSSGATTYNVYRGAKTGGPYSLINSPSTNSYSDTGVHAGTYYYYVVASVTSSVTSAEIDEASTETTPSAPSSLHAAVAGPSQVNLTWAITTGATSYVIERGSTTGGPSRKSARATRPATPTRACRAERLTTTSSRRSTRAAPVRRATRHRCRPVRRRRLR